MDLYYKTNAVLYENQLTHFMPLVTFYTHFLNLGFLMFSGGIERDQWHDLG